MPPPPTSRLKEVSQIIATRLLKKPAANLYDVSISNGVVTAIQDHKEESDVVDATSITIDANGGLGTPSFCHAHVHLDKCFILSDPKFHDLEIVNGDFGEAMDITGQAKQRFEEEDLLRRGRRLIEESVQYGVTCMRAFVEVDEVVEMKCLNAALVLKAEWAGQCYVQICAFAQLALFTGSAAEHRRALLEEALTMEGVEVVGSTPYVEDGIEQARQNVERIIELSLRYKKHMDLHLDYSLGGDEPALIWDVLALIKRMDWINRADLDLKLSFGHCTKFTTFDDNAWHRLRSEIGDLPISFVGLPTSDLFMMGRPATADTTQRSKRPRGTLQIVEMIERYGLECAMSINNIGNAFTPQGSCNPLRLANLAVGVYQASTKQAVGTIFEAISTRAKKSIGANSGDLELKVGDHADLLIFDNAKSDQAPKNTFDVVILPDSATVLHRIYNGQVVA